MSGEFIAQYVQNCIEDGIQTPAGIREKAEEEIGLINIRIQEIEELRTKQNCLRAVIRHLGGGTKSNNTSVKTMDFSIPWNDLEDSFKKICLSVCNLVQTSPNIFPRDIMNIVAPASGLDAHEHKAVYSAIKWLLLNNVLTRYENGSIKAGEALNAFVEKSDDSR